MKINKEFQKLISSNVINRLGDGIDSIALTWLMYQVTGSASWSAIFFACNQLPSVLIQPIAGALIEHRNKKRVMFISDFIRAFLVIILIIFMLLNTINPVILIIFTLLVSTVEAFRVPAGIPLVKKLLNKETYDKGIGLNSTANTLATLIGTALSGIIVANFGYMIAMTLDAISFIFSAILIYMIKIPQENNLTDKNKIIKKQSIKDYINLIGEGFKYAINSKNIKLIIIFSAIINGLLVPINALLAPLISEVFVLDIKFLSIFSISLSLGTIIGSILYTKYGEKIKEGYNFLTLLGTLIGFNYILIYLVAKISNQLIVKIALILIPFSVGISMVMSISKLTVVFMQEVEEKYISRIGALFNSVSSAIVPVLSFVISSLVVFLRVDIVFFLFGLFAILTMIILNNYYKNYY